MNDTTDWQLGPFMRSEGVSLKAQPELSFHCPVSGRPVAWAAKDVFNPGAVVREGRVHLLIRAEDDVGPYSGTSRIGLAVSDDGVSFQVEPEPVLFPADDAWRAFEWPGGCEDPRVVESPDGGYVCSYTAFDGKTARLFVATSNDLRIWTKHGCAFAGTAYESRWAKSGAIATELRDGRLVAAKLEGRYWMYWGEGVCFAATSPDLVRWTPLEFDAGEDRRLTHTPGAGHGAWSVQRIAGQRALRPLLFPRRGRFDSALVEPGPPALVTRDGVVLLYNGANHPKHGDATLPAFAYQSAQALFDARDPSACIARANEPFLRAEANDERNGQVGNVCFAQGLVLHDGRFRLYYGMADSKIGCATAPGITRRSR